ncbi:MAG: DNA/RNA helicase domain-containing protein [Bacillota bacterium]
MTSYYSTTVQSFLAATNNDIIGSLAKGQSQDVHERADILQTRSWIDQIKLLKESLNQISSLLRSDDGLVLEYFIPRRPKRIDAVVLTHGIIFVLEFKCKSFLEASLSYQQSDIRQCEDYALDLRDFHKESRGKPIVPVLIDTSAKTVGVFKPSNQAVKNIITVNNAITLTTALVNHIKLYGSSAFIDLKTWEASPYEPTPTIIEAAQRLYAKHNVRDITTTGADRYNLGITTDAVLQAINFAMKSKRKVIVFVTGVPGSGKTLVGLNIAHNENIRAKGFNAAFLSGNYPLVTVLQRALAVDKAHREDIAVSTALRDAATKVQHVIDFKRHYHLHDEEVPYEHIIIFDEAQRAWNKEQMIKKSDKFKPYTCSEPELIMNIMNRQNEWCVVIGLVGSGQEIHNGEAGLREWGESIRTRHSDWVTFCSPLVLEVKRGFVGNQTLFNPVPNNLMVHNDSALHLRTSIRSYKASMLSDWVNAVLSGKPENAKQIMAQLSNYPIVITRDLAKAKKWVKEQCRGTRNSGLVCSSGAKRLRPYGIETELERDSTRIPHWFLLEKDDIRSSSFLELAMTEFDIQGLERDWILLAWDQDLVPTVNGWLFRDFSGSKWKNVQDATKKEYLLNTYRVLLTRAREGLAIFVPQGDVEDKTRNPEEYDRIVSYLQKAGVQELE